MKNILIENMLRFKVKNLSDPSMKVLLEQLSKLKDFKYGENPDMLPAPELGKMSGVLTKTQNAKAAEVNKNLQSQLQELKAHPAYNVLINALGNSGHTKLNTNIWCWKLSHDVRKEFLDQTQEWLNTEEGKRALKKQNKLPIIAQLDRDKGDKKVIPGTQQPVLPAFKAPLSISGTNVYEDNSANIASALDQEIDRWLSEVQLAIKMAKQVNPNATIECVKMDIASSCSRLRNTNGQTWEQLSQARANNVYNILSAKLKEIGVTISPEFTKVLRTGYNGDGSSGPDPANNFTFNSGKTTTTMGYSKTGGETEPLSGPDQDRFVGEYGKLLSTQAESHQYKFCIASIEFQIKASDLERLTKPTVEYSRGYTLTLDTKSDTSNVRIKKFPVPDFKRKETEVKRRLDICPVFSSDTI